jgi:iron complex outermembrane receptor protein
MAGAAIVALLPASHARAEAAPAGGGNSGGAAAVGEIIVTAQRRAERLQDVPISVTAVTAQTLSNAGIISTRDLELVTPGLRLDEGGIFVQPVIRGITTTQTYISTEAPVATYIDGVYQQSTLSGFYDMPDVREVEVLKGPQGTLFGRNATGGAILINTENPDLSEPTGHVTSGGGNYQYFYGKGFVSAPIIKDKLGVSLGFLAEHTPGYKTNILTDQTFSPISNVMLRGKIRFDPWQGADFVLTGFYSNLVDHDSIKDVNWNGNNIAKLLGLPPSQIATQPNTYASDIDTYLKPRSAAISLRGTIEMGPGTLTTTTGYNRQRTTLLTDGDNSPLPLAVVTFASLAKTFTQEEVYTTNKLGRFQATGGVFYYWNEGSMLPLDVNYGQQDIWTIDKTHAWAIFGEVTFDLTDRLSIIGGLRYSWEKKQAYAAFTVGAIQPSIPLLGEQTWDAVTPRASVRYKVTDTTNAYFTYSEGFKSGAYNTVAFQPDPANPEKINAYELGVKSHPVANFSINGAMFLYDYNGLQIPTIQQEGAAYVQTLRNAATAKIKGVELDGAWNITNAFNVTFGGTYLHARYTHFPDAVINIPTEIGGVPIGGNTSVQADVSGNTMIGAPTWSANATGNYVLNTSVGRFQASGTIYFSSKVYFDVGNRVNQPSYTIMNATLSWKPPTVSQLEVRFWIRNLTDKAVIQATTIENAADSVHYNLPRTFGFEGTYSF